MTASIQNIGTTGSPETCVLCGAALPTARHRNNPWPVAEEGNCCISCNALLVIPARLREAAAHERGREKGYLEGLEKGWEEGCEKGYQEAMERDESEAAEKAYEEGRERGYQEGLEKGWEEGRERAAAEALEVAS